jgi:hypothetical protein
MTFRILHRYLGYFLAGIMMVYALSGITLIFRKTDTFKITIQKELIVEAGLDSEKLGQALRIRNLTPIETNGAVLVFEQGTYDTTTGEAKYTSKVLPGWLDKLTHLHKATTEDPLYYFNIFFGFALLFLAVSSFFMFAKSSLIFKKAFPFFHLELWCFSTGQLPNGGRSYGQLVYPSQQSTMDSTRLGIWGSMDLSNGLFKHLHE